MDQFVQGAQGALGGLWANLASVTANLRWPGQAPAQLASISTLQRPQVHVPQQQEQKQRRSFGRGWRRPRSPQFSCHVCAHPAAQQQQCQELVAVGSKIWGCAVLPLAKIYDFALYFDPRQLKDSQLHRQFEGERLQAAPRSPDFYRSLGSTGDVDFTLVVRASRNLPIRLVAAEYRRILRRRLASLGASADDPGLLQMLEAFSEERLPASIKRGGCVLRGTELTFSKRGREGVLSAAANGQPIARVQSAPLCAAIINTYLGWDQPVSTRARQLAGESLVRMMAGSGGGPSGLACSQEACRLPQGAGRG